MSDQTEISNGPLEEPEDLGASLTFRERALRDRFVGEYFVDFDAYQAAVRVGYNQGYAKEYAIRLMHCPYVLQQIRKHETEDPEETPEVMRKRVISGLVREANYRGPGSSPSARVAALAKLASIQGMDAPSRSKLEMTGADGQPLGGGVFVVPGVCSVEEWEAAAAKQQADLVSGKTPAQVAPETVVGS